MISRVLLGYDGSAAADRAAEFAIELASRFGAELHVLSVARPPEFGTEVESEAIIEQGRRHCSKLLKPLRSRLKKSALKAHFEVAIGHPSEQNCCMRIVMRWIMSSWVTGDIRFLIDGFLAPSHAK